MHAQDIQHLIGLLVRKAAFTSYYPIVTYLESSVSLARQSSRHSLARRRSGFQNGCKQLWRRRGAVLEGFLAEHCAGIVLPCDCRPW